MEKGGGGGAASSRADATSSFTVFVSPPWSVPSSIKHVTFSEAFPAIGGLGGGGGRRARMTLSRSLESIPENAVWHAGKGVSVGAAGAGFPGGGATSRDASTSARGSLLPPIRHTAAAIAGGDLDLPEMRARAFSDPNAYQTASTRDRQQHIAATTNAMASSHPIRSADSGSSGGGLAKVSGPSSTTAAAAASAATTTPRPPATPPKKPPSPKSTRKAAAPVTLSTAKRLQHESNGGSDDADSPPSTVTTAGGQSPSKERADVRLGGGVGPKAAIAADRVLNALVADAAGPASAVTHKHTTAAAAAAAGHSSQASALASLLKAGGGSGAAATSSHAMVTAAAAGNGARGRMSTAVAAAARDLPSPPPLAAAQRSHSKAAASGAALSFFDDHTPTGVQPRIVHPPNIDRGGRGQLNRHARHADKEVDTSRTAFALVGSPGRRRWPSPHREATSFISATPQGRPMASASTAAAAASFGGSHSYSGPMSPIAAAVARDDVVGSRSGGSSVGGSEESLNWSGGGDAGRWCSAASVKTLGAIDIPSAAAAGGVSAGACSKEFQTILSGFIASGSAASAAAIGRDGDYGRDGRQAPDDMLAETRAHFLRAGCRPISDSL